MSSGQNPFQQPATTRAALRNTVLLIASVALGREIADRFGISFEIVLWVWIAASAVLAIGTFARRRDVPALLLLVPAYLLIAAFLGLLYTIRLASQDSWNLPYVLLLLLLVVSLLYLVVSVRKHLYPRSPDGKAKPLGDHADDLL
jgi:small-conductance mechanosensitive channel